MARLQTVFVACNVAMYVAEVRWAVVQPGPPSAGLVGETEPAASKPIRTQRFNFGLIATVEQVLCSSGPSWKIRLGHADSTPSQKKEAKKAKKFREV
jgi:hypothetical protein